MSFNGIERIAIMTAVVASMAGLVVQHRQVGQLSEKVSELECHITRHSTEFAESKVTHFNWWQEARDEREELTRQLESAGLDRE